MSKWGSFNDTEGGEGQTAQDLNAVGTNLFSSTPTSKLAPYQQRLAQPIDAKDAAVQVSSAIKANFAICDRLPKAPSFKLPDGEVSIEDGVMGAMGTTAAQLLELAPTPGVSLNLGLGSSNSKGQDDDV